MRSLQEIQDRIRVCEARLRSSQDPEERNEYRMELSALRWVTGPTTKAGITQDSVREILIEAVADITNGVPIDGPDGAVQRLLALA